VSCAVEVLEDGNGDEDQRGSDEDGGGDEVGGGEVRGSEDGGGGDDDNGGECWKGSYPFPSGRLRPAVVSSLYIAVLPGTPQDTKHTTSFRLWCPYALPQATWLLEHIFLVKSEVKYYTLSLQLPLLFFFHG